MQLRQAGGTFQCRHRRCRLRTAARLKSHLYLPAQDCQQVPGKSWQGGIFPTTSCPDLLPLLASPVVGCCCPAPRPQRVPVQHKVVVLGPVCACRGRGETRQARKRHVNECSSQTAAEVWVFAVLSCWTGHVTMCSKVCDCTLLECALTLATHRHTLCGLASACEIACPYPARSLGPPVSPSLQPMPCSPVVDQVLGWYVAGAQSQEHLCSFMPLHHVVTQAAAGSSSSRQRQQAAAHKWCKHTVSANCS